MWIALICFAIIFALLLYLDSRKPLNFPPGPKWLPILGCAVELNKIKNKSGNIAIGLYDLSKKYGNIMGVRVGTDRSVFVQGQKEIKEFLQNEDLLTRPTGAFYTERTMGRTRGIIFTSEEVWQEQRRYVLKNLKEFGYGKSNMSDILQEECEHMKQHITKLVKENNGKLVLPMNNAFGIHVLNTLWSMMAGIRYSPDEKEVKNLQDILRELFNNMSMIGAPFSHFPVLRYLAPELSGYNMYIETHKPLWKFIQEEIDRHKKTFDPENPRDLIDMYLRILNTPNKTESFNELQLLSICVDLFMAGSETTNNSLSFGLLYLILNQDVIKKAQEEIDTVVGRERLPSLNDRPNMPYMDGIVYESVRMMMGRGLSIPHTARKDTTLAGYSIPKGTMVIANPHSILLSKDSGLDDPEAFNPERHIKDGKIVLADTYLPFGFGKRRCLGESLAKANLFVFMATLLQNFNLNVPEGHPPPSTQGVDGITATTQPFSAEIVLRT